VKVGVPVSAADIQRQKQWQLQRAAELKERNEVAAKGTDAAV
jgi:hypothetical protein